MSAQAQRRASATPGLAQSSERQLVAAALSRDEAAIRELIRRMNPRLFRVARGIVSSDAEAEEAVQETYLSAFTRLGEFQGRSSFSTWVTRIAINNALMLQRKVRPQEEFDTVSEASNPQIVSFPGCDLNDPEVSTGRSQLRSLLEQAVSNLPADLRLPLLLHETEGLKVRAIAELLNLNVVTVRTRLYRARRQMRTELEAQLERGFDSIFPFDGARCAGMADRVVARLQN